MRVQRRQTFAGLFVAAIYSAVVGAEASFELTLVDDAAHGYATFQSHNQKVAAGPTGIFMTHLRTRNEAYTAQQWRLSRSTDGGDSFETVYEETAATNPPVIEIDGDGNLYLVRADFVDGNAYLYRFDAASDFGKPIITPIPNAAAGKYALMLDGARRQLYFFSHNNSFHVLSLDGEVQVTYNLLAAGRNAVLQYPHLVLTPQGQLHAAWTTQHREKYMYRDIHHIFSPDAGTTWRDMGGATLTPPFAADDTGPSTRISLEDEFDVHTWLSNFTVREGKAHFVYLAQSRPGKHHYTRFDVRTGVREVDTTPDFKGSEFEVRSMSGFFATREDSALYYVGSSGGRLVCLRTSDNGDSWEDVALGVETFHVYSLGGARRVTDDGYIIGSFTDQHGDNGALEFESKVYFFRMRAED